MIPSPRTARFLRSYLRGSVAVLEQETVVTVRGEPREATLYLPERRRPGGRPAWVVLHGMTVPGRKHKAMARFVRALAASGAAVLVPDVPAWRALRVEEGAALDTLVAGSRFLAERGEASAGEVGAIGFSFGATQALIAASDPQLREVLTAVVGFGGYCDLGRVVRFLFTAEHEWRGERFRIEPDPYGRWMLAANYLTRIPGCEGMTAVQEAAHDLAREAGRRREWAWDPAYDPVKARLRASLPGAEEREVWDMIAPPAGRLPGDDPEAVLLGERFARVMAEDPSLDPRHHVSTLRARVVLSHGRADRLIPFSETLRLASVFPERLQASATITGLLAHSGHAGWMHPLARVREAGVFVRLLNRALAAV